MKFLNDNLANTSLLLDQHRQISQLQEAERMRQAAQGQIPGLGQIPGALTADPTLLSR